jgi:thymidylate kinase
MSNISNNLVISYKGKHYQPIEDIHTKSKIISLEGITFSRKTELFESLKDDYKDYESVCFIPEQESTLTDSQCKSISDLRDSNPKKYSFAYHLDKLEMMYKAVKNAVDLKYKVIITEGSIYSLKTVYLADDVNNDNITFLQYQLYNSIFNRFANELSLECVIFFDAIPKISYLRRQLIVSKNLYQLESFEAESDGFKRWLSVISSVPQIKIHGCSSHSLKKVRSFINNFL